MSLELTPEGTEAYRVLRWAQADPVNRAADAQRQVNDLARPLLGDSSHAAALAEVQDAGTMLGRLADSLAPSADTGITGQAGIAEQALGPETITGQFGP